MQIRKIILGILVAFIHRSVLEAGEAGLPEPSFYRALSIAAERLGIDVYVFTAADYHEPSGQLHAYRFVQNRWVRQTVPLPDIIYDRCFYTKANQRIHCRSMLEEIAHRKSYSLLNGSLPAKLVVYAALKEDNRLSTYLPYTIHLQSADQLKQLLDRYGSGIVLKPDAGMQGRGLAHVKRCPLEHTIQVSGQSRQNQPFTLTCKDDHSFALWIESFINRSTYLLQPYLTLSGDDGKPFDVRALLQKDDKSVWSLSGIAIRQGQAGSLTSNLHGGGDAHPAAQLLTDKFGIRIAERLLEQIHTISKQTAVTLESHFGRFAEFGFDYGIEPDGRLWLIEVNAKPGRSAFRRIGDKRAGQLSLERLLQYTQFLSKRFNPSFVTHESVFGCHPSKNFNNQIMPFNVQEVHR